MPSLTMPLFVSPADVMLRMQLNDELAGIEDIVASGIIGAQLHVERILGSKITRQIHDCNYFVDGDAFSGITPGGVFRLEVPSGFLRTDSPPIVSASSPNAGPFGGLEAIDTDFLRIDHNRGYLLLDVASYQNCYIHVLCDTGFEDGTKPTPVTGVGAYDTGLAYSVGDQVVQGGRVYTCTVESPVGVAPASLTHWKPSFVPMEQIPAELYEAILSLVPMVFNSNQTTTRRNEAIKQYQVLTDHAAMLLQAFTRTKGFTFRPI